MFFVLTGVAAGPCVLGGGGACVSLFSYERRRPLLRDSTVYGESWSMRLGFWPSSRRVQAFLPRLPVRDIATQCPFCTDVPKCETTALSSQCTSPSTPCWSRDSVIGNLTSAMVFTALPDWKSYLLRWKSIVSGWSEKVNTVVPCFSPRSTEFSHMNFLSRFLRSRVLSGYTLPLCGCQRGRDSEEKSSLLGLASFTPASLSMLLVMAMRRPPRHWCSQLKNSSGSCWVPLISPPSQFSLQHSVLMRRIASPSMCRSPSGALIGSTKSFQMVERSLFFSAASLS